MPFSYNVGKLKMKNLINILIDSNKSKVLDIGCGAGIYGKLISKSCYCVAVDAVDYREKYGLMQYYDEFHQFDMRDTEELKKLGHFDLIIMGDVLEHVTPEEARKVLNVVEEMTKYLLVAVPFLYPQHYEDNHWENHLQPDLTLNIMKERYPELRLISLYKDDDNEPSYGYYLWENNRRLQ